MLCILCLELGLCIVNLCSGCDGCCAFCLIWDATSFSGAIFVYSRIVAVCLCPACILLQFLMQRVVWYEVCLCLLRMHEVPTGWVGRTTALYVGVSISICLPHAVVFSSLMMFALLLLC